MTKQALNYLLGQLEQLGYLTRETDSNDQRSKRVRLTPEAMLQPERSTRSSRRSKPNGNDNSDPESSASYATYSRSSTRSQRRRTTTPKRTDQNERATSPEALAPPGHSPKDS